MNKTITKTITAFREGEHAGCLDLTLRLDLDNGGFGSNSNKYTLILDTASGGQSMYINGEETRHLEITIMGDWEFADFTNQFALFGLPI